MLDVASGLLLGTVLRRTIVFVRREASKQAAYYGLYLLATHLHYQMEYFRLLRAITLVFSPFQMANMMFQMATCLFQVANMLSRETVHFSSFTRYCPRVLANMLVKVVFRYIADIYYSYIIDYKKLHKPGEAKNS